ncbi:hypothetical protein MOZ60_08000 [Stecheria sp. CLA-KB-P133]|uniref:Uncharacterized protein n=1 Tax=Grylomicrobium aquisgranensis TaxID=2926318 RepID=A0AB35U6A6_9FIRM|nr:hypothetical protein [Stecheria sp. CLA-KB-P133]
MSKSIEKHKISLHGIDIVVISLALAEMVKSIPLISNIPNIDILLSFINFLNYILLLVVIFQKRYSGRLFLLFAFFAIIFAYGYLKSHMSAFLTAWLLLFALKDMDLSRILNDIHLSLGITIIIAIIFGIFSLGDFRSQFNTGFHLGFGHKNTFGAFLFEYYLTGLLAHRGSGYQVWKCIVFGLFVLLFTKSKTAAASLLLLPIILVIFERGLYSKFRRLFVFIAELIAPILLLFTYATAELFPVNTIVQKMNVVLTNRIFLNWFILSKNKITLFGQNVQLNYSGIYNEIINKWNINTTVDGTYIIMLLLLGLIPTIMFMIGYVAVVHRGGKRKDYLLITAAVLLANYALMETRFTSIFFNFVFFYLTAKVADVPRLEKKKNKVSLKIWHIEGI